MLRLSDQEISELYAMICHYHNTYLAKEGVRLPKLRRGQEYTKDALTLVYLAYHYPDTRIVTKEELTAFIRLYPGCPAGTPFGCTERLVYSLRHPE